MSLEMKEQHKFPLKPHHLKKITKMKHELNFDSTLFQYSITQLNQVIIKKWYSCEVQLHNVLCVQMQGMLTCGHKSCVHHVRYLSVRYLWQIVSAMSLKLLIFTCGIVQERMIYRRDVIDAMKWWKNRKKWSNNDADEGFSERNNSEIEEMPANDMPPCH